METKRTPEETLKKAKAFYANAQRRVEEDAKDVVDREKTTLELAVYSRTLEEVANRLVMEGSYLLVRASEARVALDRKAKEAAQKRSKTYRHVQSTKSKGLIWNIVNKGLLVSVAWEFMLGGMVVVALNMATGQSAGGLMSFLDVGVMAAGLIFLTVVTKNWWEAL